MAPGIIIVDDSSLFCQMIATFLRYKVPGRPIYTCPRGGEAIDICANVDVSCVLLDYTLPDTDGVSLAKTLIEQWPHLPVILLTGRSEADIHHEAMLAGCVDVIVKPSSLDRLFAAIQPFLVDPDLSLATRDLTRHGSNRTIPRISRSLNTIAPASQRAAIPTSLN